MVGVDAFIDQSPHCGHGGFRIEHVLAVAAELSHRVDAVRPIGDRGRQIGEDLRAGTPTVPGRYRPMPR
jgi:hypothetical protein